uniref:Phospholipase A2 n=1 Tax=Sparus aurata TaxID=8175 RepID=A0A671U5C6_SPAAU
TPTLHLFSFFLTSCTVSGQQESRSLWQFRNMIKCVQPDVLFALKYDNYGCYCGYGGQGTPVDELDQCCKVHDDCYEAQMNDPECKSFWPHLKPYFIYYRYTCTEHQPTCSGKTEPGCFKGTKYSMLLGKSPYFENWVSCPSGPP